MEEARDAGDNDSLSGRNIEMIRISDEYVVDILDKKNEPKAFCHSGDIVVFETRDCYDNSLTSEERPLGDRGDALENPATGPLYVREARKGDILKVEILKIALRSWGAMRTSVSGGEFRERYEKRTARIFSLKENRIVFDDRLTLTPDPMIGVIGTAPAGEGVYTHTPGEHGGNMDCNKITEGSVLYLPVNTDGALLALGDIHARMGDGEVLICGLETAAEVTVRVTVIQDSRIPTPFLRCRGRVMTIQSAVTLDEAAHLASNRMYDFIQSVSGQDDVHTGMLMSLVSDLAICQVVDPQKTVRSEIPESVLEAYGYVLP